MKHSTPESERIALLMLKIRHFELSLDRLFEQGVIAGTYHRCIGQEATAIGFTSALDPERDYVVSNHRNHGHYLAFSGDFEGLYYELRGSRHGVTGGRGGSQVIFGSRFYSSGILGSTIPIAAGLAWGLELDHEPACVVCFMGDGVFGEGVVYETLNLASLRRLPIVFVVEHNHLAQSTDFDSTCAGTLPARLEAFDITTTTVTTTDVFELIELAAEIITRVRTGAGPQAVVVDAARLCAHSRGDDPRPPELVAALAENDPVRRLPLPPDSLAALDREARDQIQALFEKDPDAL